MTCDLMVVELTSIYVTIKVLQACLMCLRRVYSKQSYVMKICKWFSQLHISKDGYRGVVSGCPPSPKKFEKHTL